MNHFEQAKQKKERGVSSKEILDDFIERLDDLDGVLIIGKEKNDEEYIISWSFSDTASVIAAIETSKYTIFENRY